MKILNRYISINIISAILLVVLVLISLEVFISFSGEFASMGTGNYGLPQAILYVLMTLPAGIYQFFPIAGLLGSLIGLGILASRSELIIMRAAGVSVIKITWIVLKAAFLIMLLAVLLGEVVGPALQHKATTYKNAAMNQDQAFHTTQGIWLRKGDDFIKIAALLPGHQLKNTTRYHFDAKHNLISSSTAKIGFYHHHHWIFQDVTVSQFHQDSITNTHYDQQEWDLKFKPKVLGILKISSNERSLPQLYSYIRYLHYSGLQTNKSEFLFWQRIFQPLAMLVMILLAIPFIFGPLRTVTMGLRILAGAVTGLAFFIINQFLEPVTTVFQLPPMAVAILPTLLVAILGIVLLLRTK